MDASQRQAVDLFAGLHLQLRSWRLFSRPEKIGLYLWGGVGRGKTLMMDVFFGHTKAKKRRLHYHELMQYVVDQLTENESAERPLDAVVKHISSETRLLCLDDLHLHDIADGKLWQGVFERALENKMFLVITSNYHPDKLLDIPGYQFKILPVLKKMKQHLHIFNLDGGQDYRCAADNDREHSRNITDSRALEQLCSKLARVSDLDFGALIVQGRMMPYQWRNADSICCNYEEICGTNRSYRDYLELSEQYDNFIVTGFDRAAGEEKSWLNRFVWLIDVLYDKQRTLYLGSSEPILDLLPKIPSVDDLARTESRLQQMLG